MHEFTPELRDMSEPSPVDNTMENCARHVDTGKRVRGPFAKLPNAVARDREIDAAELVFITWRASYIEWTCSEAAILAAKLVKPNTGFGRNAIRAAMSRARQHGFLTRVQANPGKFDGVIENFEFPPSDDGYTEIPRIWFDGTLSVKAKAARIFFAAGTGFGPETYGRELSARFSWNRATANKVIRELRTRDLIETRPVRSTLGQFDGAVHHLKVRAGDQKPGIGKSNTEDQKPGDGKSGNEKPGDGKSGNVQRLSPSQRISKDKDLPTTNFTPAEANLGGDDSVSELKVEVSGSSLKPRQAKPSRLVNPLRPNLVECEVEMLNDHFEYFMRVYPFPDKSGWYEQSRAEFERIVFAETAADGCYFADVSGRILDAAIEYRNKKPQYPRNPFQWLKNKGYEHVDSVEAPKESLVARRARALGLAPENETYLERLARIGRANLGEQPKKETHLQRRARLMGLTSSVGAVLDLTATPKESSFADMDVLSNDEEA